MIEYNDKNCEKLAEYIVAGKSFQELVELAKGQLLSDYKASEDVFRYDVESSGFGEEDEDE